MWRDMDSAKQWDPEKLHMSQFETKTDEYEQVYKELLNFGVIVGK